MNASARPTSTTAILSLVFGLLAWLMVPLLGSIAAIVCGHLARGEIRRAGGQLEGDGMAIAGLVLGYLQMALVLFALVAVMLFFGGLAAFLAVLAAHG
ncbi:MAG: DUF4190 domain-containing protein [Xanthomonadales bacterium]|nr:DUF4190 domain-containing protein [Xanthomonadales bacterium]